MTTVSTSHTSETTRPSRSTRVLGYLVAAGVNIVLLWLLNVAPGWRRLPLLSEDFSHVLGAVSFTLVAGAAANLIYLGFDPPLLRRLGDAVTTGVGLAATLQLLRVFPFDLGAGRDGLETALRVLLIMAAVGAAIAVLTNIGLLLRDLTRAQQRAPQ